MQHLRTLIICGLLCLPRPGQGAADVLQLQDQLDSGAVVLEEVAGTGASSGTAIEAWLSNTTDATRRIGVHLRSPLYFTNRGRGQNMLATRIYGRDGSYLMDAGTSLIELKPGERKPVVFVAYCANFDRENPTRADRFGITSPPAEIGEIASTISTYEQANPHQDITVAAQVALWLWQGETAAEIRARFPFSSVDEQLAQTLIQSARSGIDGR